ncbi:uncharacterized protein KY384_006321 [Bacidia gigantensis]|uniref:uncharacterized protein n=1 Tax=Bacidia gigantensis TaxID=2732470 RepID=UPI001D05940F|nr:uncharacterized protein KY384_006321 [Bacidia gigantensis]KAG8528634.1 hypothetical protein KY384_006321 [Bacidia gigantensis]
MPSANRITALRIAIIGGGIGGLSCALQLHHHCVKARNVIIDIYEQAAKYSEIGAGVGIGANAVKLFAQLGLEDALRAIGGTREGIWMSFRRHDNGEDILTVPADNAQKTGQLGVHRAELLELLAKEVQSRNAATLHIGKRCKKLEAWLHFSEISSADLVIASDGINSAVRAQYAPEEAVYSGRLAYRALIPMDQISPWWPLPSKAAMFLSKGRIFLTYPIGSSNKIMNALTFRATPQESLGDLKESWSSSGSKSELRNDFEGFNDIVQKIIELMPEKPSKWVLNDRNPLDQWTYANGKVILLGDAAHATLPYGATGAGQSIEDGYILAKSLEAYLEAGSNSTGDGNRPPLQGYANLYQDVRRPRAQKAQQASRESGKIFGLESADMTDQSYEACVSLFPGLMKERMKWVWEEDIDAAFLAAHSQMK